MKKLFICTITLLFLGTSVMADDARYINALKNCAIYSETGNVNTNGTNAASSKKILGWQNDKCIYKETVQMGAIKADVNCKFTKPQLHEIASVMDAYMLTVKYSGEEVDTSSLDAVKTNPVVKVWNKYMQNPDVCSVDMEQ